jgi:ABC-type Mn2+/Zn2+ transport system permease subunit
MISNYESQNQLKRTYFGAVVLTILLGIASRKFSQILFPFLSENAGDVLWAMMVYFGFRFLLLKKRMLLAIFLSFLFSFGIEFSQLYQDDWINQIRGTLLGALILGKGFLSVDLIRYTTGIIIALSLDSLVIIKKQKNK